VLKEDESRVRDAGATQILGICRRRADFGTDQAVAAAAANVQGQLRGKLYHACEYAAAPDPAQAKPYAIPLRDALRAGSHAEAHATFRKRKEPSECPGEKAPVRAALRYRYPRATAPNNSILPLRSPTTCLSAPA
jgi:hypothetical protein